MTIDERALHPSTSVPTPLRRWAAAPPIVGLTVFGVVALVTATAVALQPGLSGGAVALVGAYGMATAILGGAVAMHLTARSAATRARQAKAMATALEREERLRLILASLHEGLIFQDRNLRIVEYNEAAAQILGLTEAAIGHHPEELAPWRPVLEDGTVLTFDQHPAAVALRTGTPIIGTTLGVSLPGNTVVVWAKVNCVPVHDDDGEIEGVLTTFTDVTTEKNAQLALAWSEAAVSEANEALSWQALHDPLTELPNRAQLVERLSVALERSKQHGTLTAVLFLDLDRFKNVNDTMGHDAGDVLLVQIADRLRGAVRSSDLVARAGGDEFVVLAEDLHDRGEALQMADRLRAAVALPVELPHGTVTITTSVGIAFDLDHRPGTLLRDADTALHKAKEAGRDRAEVFDDSLRAETIRRMATEQVLRRALDEDGLRVLYQPIVDLTTGEVVGVEALLRILGPSGELLSPTPFIAIGEDTGLIVPVGAGVLDDACRQLDQWRDELGPRAPRSISVNLSARQIITRSFPSVVARTLSRYGIEPAALTLELTETTLIEAGHVALETVQELHDLGVALAIDDFGTGYSSLSYLKRFPVDIVKVDRSFVAGLGLHQHDLEIVRAVLALGQSLDLVTVAEGVETLDQLELLRTLGCDRAQGFLLARPLHSNDVPAAIERIRSTMAAQAARPAPRKLRVAGE